VLLELFRRIGVEDPWFVECVPAGSDPATTTFLARALGWNGAILEDETATYASLGERLAAKALPRELDLLVLGPNGDPAWSRLGEHRPHVIVTSDGERAPRALAQSHGYTWIGSESSGTSAFFVRDDLVARSRFTAPER